MLYIEVLQIYFESVTLPLDSSGTDLSPRDTEGILLLDRAKLTHLKLNCCVIVFSFDWFLWLKHTASRFSDLVHTYSCNFWFLLGSSSVYVWWFYDPFE